MGRPYRAELAQLEATTREALELDIKPLTRAVEDSAAHGLVIVASGGSQTTALYLGALHQARFGHPCRVVTPLVFRHDSGLARGNVWLLSAGGRNADILGAADHAIDAGAKSITALISTRDTPLQAKLATYGGARSYTYSLTTGSDGFLATNSLWSMCLLLENAYVPDERDRIEQDALGALRWAAESVQHIGAWSGTLVGLGDPDTLIGLQDLEMRATEAALAPTWVSDLRNLGHGRHYWFEALRDQARAICLYTAAYADLARETLSLLATVSPVYDVEVPGNGRTARLASIAWSMRAALELGSRIERDPGRPGVPAFGEALYELAYEHPVEPPTGRDADRVVAAKIGRPLGMINEVTRVAWREHLSRFKQTLANAEIRGIVSDFDGTLIETTSRYEPIPESVVTELSRLLDAGLVLGIATGRGDSCGEALRCALPERVWQRVWMGYHNGATVQRLDIENVPDCPAEPSEPDMLTVYQRLWDLVVGDHSRGRLRLYPRQCSMTLLDGSTLEQAWTRAHVALDDFVRDGRVRIWMSSHSIDVVSHDVSKQAVISHVAAAANCLPKNILTLGDRGRWPGNDSELLGRSLSLSSDECSLEPTQCWNLAGPLRRQVAATCFHLSRLTISKHGVARYQENGHE